MVNKSKVMQDTQKPSYWAWNEDTGWIDINDFLKKVNKLSKQIGSEQEKKKCPK